MDKAGGPGDREAQALARTNVCRAVGNTRRWIIDSIEGRFWAARIADAAPRDSRLGFDTLGRNSGRQEHGEDGFRDRSVAFMAVGIPVQGVARGTKSESRIHGITYDETVFGEIEWN